MSSEITEHNNIINNIMFLSIHSTIPIGAKIKLYNNDILHIFYGYNHDKSLICCFPDNVPIISPYIKYVSINKIEKYIV